MSHVWDEFVLGGTDKPRFLCVNENLEDNQYFNDGTVGDWIKASASGTLSVEENDNAIGQNVLNYIDPTTSTNDDYIYKTYDIAALVGGTVYGKKYLLKLRVLTAFQIRIVLYDGTVYHDVYVDGTAGKWVDVFIITNTILTTSTTIVLRVYSKNDPDRYNIYLDDIFFGEIQNDMIFWQPNESNLLFEENIIGKNEKWNGMIQKFDRKWKPVYYANWEYLGSGWELYRQTIYSSPLVFCIPHIDVDWGFLGIFDDDLKREYSFDRFFGHTGYIQISGVEFIKEQPEYQSGTGTLYFDGGEIATE